MYLTHYNLKIKPFGISPDSRFFWLGEKHAEALATLRYGLLDNKGFLLVTGDVGTGKTALINRLVQDLEIKVTAASIPDPGLEILDFFRILAFEFNMDAEFSSKGEFLIQFKKFLLKAYAKKSRVLLIIDEAQRLNHELLEQIRLLSNIELDTRKLINIFFVGQNEFNDMLLEERNRAVRQRIALRYNIDPLTENETDQYIKHRLEIACATYNIFTADAVHAIYSVTNGYPRLINIICDHALLSGYVSGIKTINRTVIKECEKDVNVSIPYSLGAADEKKPKEAYITPDDWLPFIEPQESAFGKNYWQIISLILLIAAVSLGAYFHIKFRAGGELGAHVNKIATTSSSDDNSLDNSIQIKQAQTMLTPSSIENPKREKAFQQKTELTPSDTNIQQRAISPPQAASGSERFEIEAQNPKASGSQFQPDRFVIYFDYNSNDLPFQEFDKLDYVVNRMSDSPDSKIIIEGFTDSVGDYDYNLRLSKFRAYVVKNYLLSKGIAAGKMEVFGRGPENPISGNDTMEGRRRNRRVEIRIE